VQDGRWLILSLLNEDKQWPTLARCLGREDLVTDSRFTTKADRHQRSVELIKIFDETFATRDLAEWRESSTATAWCSASSAFWTTSRTTGR
jgi:formyl-CoA transferase